MTKLAVGPTIHFSVAAYAVDGSQSLLSNGRTLTYAQVAAIVDSDGDGLRDAQEDVNLNRKRDSGETDPHMYDTDRDGISDGAEVAAGTNPLDPRSVKYCTGACASAIWLDAALRVQRYSGAMTADARYAAGHDGDANANALTSLQLFPNSTAGSMSGGSGDEAQYAITLPSSGTWYLWARFYYPGAPNSNDANSFFVRVDEGKRLKFGNNKDRFRDWHWDGNGDVETGGLLPLNLGTLAAGAHKLTIEKREGYPIPPRIDVLVLTRESKYVPNDVDASAVLSGGAAIVIDAGFEDSESTAEEPAVYETTTTTTTTLQAPCTSHDECDDDVACTLERCDPESGECFYFGFDALCDDGDACSGAEICDVFADCHPTEALVCDDDFVCNGVETCDPVLGCVASASPTCDDGIACTDDHCVEDLGGCQNFVLDGACDDGNACTVDRCTASGCAYDQITSVCDDELACTFNDQCVAGVCAGSDTCGSGSRCNAELGSCERVHGDPDDDGLRGDEDPCPLEARNLCAGPAAIDASNGLSLRVNAYPAGGACGGAKIDCNGDLWIGDFGYQGEGDATVCDLGNADGACTVAGVEASFGCTSEETQDLLRCQHVVECSHAVSYGFDVPDGRYVVNLLFASIEEEAHGRMHVAIEGATVADDLDVAGESGGKGRALVHAFVVVVRDGNGLQIELTALEGRSALGAIEVLARKR
jgi:hypothetical protein